MRNKLKFLFAHNIFTLLYSTTQRLTHFYVLKVKKQQFYIKKIFNYTMILNLKDSGLSRALMFFGKRELEHKYLLENYLPEGSTVLDLGANIGYYACMEAKIIGGKGRIIAIEPHPDNLRLLRINIDLNGIKEITTVVHGGGGDVSGTADLHVSDHSNLHTFLKDKNSNGQAIEVPIFTFQQIIDNYGEIDFLRMDIEGFEVNVLRSLLKSLPSMIKKPTVLFETHLPKYSSDHNLVDIMSELFTLGYRPTAIASNEHSGCPLHTLGYKPDRVIKTDGKKRGIYTNVTEVHAIDLVNRLGGVRAVLLSSV